MIELELLGVEADGAALSLNDSEGNRYSLPITDNLRAAVHISVPRPEQPPQPISPREIQAMFRAGSSVDDVAQISSLPASQLLALEHPIAAERRYMADQARSYRQARELGGLTIDELVTARLIERGVSADGVAWDSYREPGAPWTLNARYTAGEVEHSALWRINAKAQALTAINDEAVWLTETQVPAPVSPWRMRPSQLSQSGAAASAPALSPNSSTLPAPVANIRPFTGADSDYAEDEGSASEVADIDIDTVLASLDSQRGRAQALPDDEQTEAGTFDSDDGERPGATLLAFPNQQELPGLEVAGEGDTAAEPAEPEIAPAVDLDAEKTAAEKATKPKKRRDRPVMPSWDEIVFGYSKSDPQ